MAKKEEVVEVEDAEAFHNKYRPRTLDEIIGHEMAVTRLRGMIEGKKLPSALLFTGPSSAGKTTTARAFATQVLGLKEGQSIRNHPDYKEINAASQRSIEDMRELEKLSRFAPQGKRRFIVIDEAQQLLANKAAAMSILKPLEEPAKRTTWILCSMDPSKFGQGDGKAVANRCKLFALEAQPVKNLVKQARRIAKSERMKYVMDDENKLLTAVAEASGGEMRTLANLMEDLYDYYNGLQEKPKRLKLSDINEVLASSSDHDDQMALQLLVAVYAGKYKAVVRSLLDVQNGFAFIQKLLWMNSFILNNAVLDGARHRKVWWSPMNKALHAELNKLKSAPNLGMMAAVNAALVEVKAQQSAFQTTPEELLSARLYHCIKSIHS